MYEQVSHSLLNRILDQLNPEIRKRDLRHFYTRLGANFYAIFSLFQLLYGKRDDFEEQMLRVVEVMTDKATVEVSAPAAGTIVKRVVDEGATVPFIARYRKEATGSLDEVVITGIRDRLEQLEAQLVHKP